MRTQEKEEAKKGGHREQGNMTPIESQWPLRPGTLGDLENTGG